MLEYVSRADKAAWRGLRALGIAIVCGLLACAPQDIAGARGVPSPTGVQPVPTPTPLPLAPWFLGQTPTWVLSDVRGVLLFSQSATAYRVAPDGVAPQPVLSFPDRPYAVKLSPDGTRVATLHFDQISEVLCVAQTGGGGRRCVRHQGGGRNALAWRPDGLALALGGSASANNGTSRLYLLDPLALEWKMLLPDNGKGGTQSVSFMPDGSAISFVENSQLWRMPMNGSGGPQMQPGFESLRNLWAAHWSPDGRSIALLSWNTDDHTLSVANADGSNHRVLLRVPHIPNSYGQLLDRPVWSPDGEWLGLSLGDCLVEPCAERMVIVSVAGKGSRILSHEGLLHDWR